MDGDLSKEELIKFFNLLASAVGEDAPTRPAEDEAGDLINTFGDGASIPAAKFQEFLVGFSSSETDKVHRESH